MNTKDARSRTKHFNKEHVKNPKEVESNYINALQLGKDKSLISNGPGGNNKHSRKENSDNDSNISEHDGSITLDEHTFLPPIK